MCWLFGLECYHVDRSETFRILVYAKTNRLTVRQRLEALAPDRGSFAMKNLVFCPDDER